MSSHWLTIALAVLLATVLTLVAVAIPDPSQPNLEFLPEMKRSPAFQAFEVAPQLPGGRAQQIAVPGTIPRGQLPLHFAATREDALRAGEELQNPYQQRLTAAGSPEATGSPAGHPQAALPASTLRGEAVYRVYCQVCHGPGGAGDGPVAQRGFPPPPPLPTGKSTQMKDGQLFHILTFGQGNMSPMAAQIDREQRWDVINFVRSLQSQAPETPAASSTNTDSTTSEIAPAQP